MPRHALAKHDLARLIHAHRVKHVLCDIDPEERSSPASLDSPPVAQWFTALELIVAHCSRSAQGRVHFITTANPIAPFFATVLVPSPWEHAEIELLLCREMPHTGHNACQSESIIRPSAKTLYTVV